MSDGFKVDVKGGAQLRRALKRAGVDLKDLSAVNRQAAATVAAAARPMTPIGPAKGGHIANTVRPGANTRAAIVRVGGNAKPYGGPIHWGWPQKNIKAQPWLTQAAKATESTWVEQYMTELEKIIGRIN